MNFFLTILIHSADLDNDEFVGFCKNFNIKFVTMNDVTNLSNANFNSIYISANFTRNLPQNELSNFINTYKNLLFFKRIHMDTSLELNVIELPMNINYIKFNLLFPKNGSTDLIKGSFIKKVSALVGENKSKNSFNVN